jgi:hypothetical protein
MKYLAILGVAALAVACESPTAPRSTASIAPASRTANAVLVNEKFESLTFAPNNCDGTLLTLQAKWHQVYGLTFDGAGGVHVSEHTNVQGQGTDATTGVDYVVSDVANLEYNAKLGFEETYTESYKLIAKGKAPNALLFSDFHITVTPNGDLTSYHDNFRIVCQ